VYVLVVFSSLIYCMERSRNGLSCVVCA